MMQSDWEHECDLHFGTVDPSGIGKIAKRYNKLTFAFSRHEFYKALTDAFELGFKTSQRRNQ